MTKTNENWRASTPLEVEHAKQSSGVDCLFRPAVDRR